MKYVEPATPRHTGEHMLKRMLHVRADLAAHDAASPAVVAALLAVEEVEMRARRTVKSNEFADTVQMIMALVDLKRILGTLNVTVPAEA